MATDDRTPEDFELARRLGLDYGPALIDFSRHRVEGYDSGTFARHLLDHIGSDVQREGYAAGPDFLARPDHQNALDELRPLVEGAARVFAFSAKEELGGIPTIVEKENAPENAYQILPPLDVFNPIARSIIAPEFPGQGISPYGADRPVRNWTLSAARVGRIALERPEKAAVGFMTLLTDNVRTMFRWLGRSGTSHISFTLHSKPPGGVQVHYHPQFFTSPTVFGGSLSTPVTQTIATGHYHFIGQPTTGTSITDPTPYFAAAHSTSGTTRRF